MICTKPYINQGLFKKSTTLQTKQTLVKTEGWFHTVGSPAMMSLYYKPFDQSRPPTKLKGATFDPMHFWLIDEWEEFFISPVCLELHLWDWFFHYFGKTFYVGCCLFPLSVYVCDLCGQCQSCINHLSSVLSFGTALCCWYWLLFSSFHVTAVNLVICHCSCPFLLLSFVDTIWTVMTIQTMSLHWQNNPKQMDVLGCNKNNDNDD